MLPCVGLMGYAGEHSSFIGGKKYLRVQGILLIAHGDVCAAMLPYFEIGLEFSSISNALLVDHH